MNLARVEAIVRAVLYEGYILYPYRPSSVKNRQRWTFGGVYPRDYAALEPSSPAGCRPMPAAGDLHIRIEVHVRFLHIVRRDVGELPVPQTDLPADGEPSFTRSSRSRSANRTSIPGRRQWSARSLAPSVTIEQLLPATDAYSVQLRWRAQQRAAARGRRPRRRPADALPHGRLRAKSRSPRRRSPPDVFQLTVRIDNMTPIDARRSSQPRRGPAARLHLDAHHPRLAERPNSFRCSIRRRARRRRRGLQQPGNLAGAGRASRASTIPPVVADHSLRLSAGGSGKPGRSLRRHRDRRDPHVAHPRHDR